MHESEKRFQAIRSSGWLDAGLGSTTAPVPCMLTEEETRMLQFVARLYAGDNLSMCDLGSFAGGSAYHIARGIQEDSPSGSGMVHAYDFFEIPEDRKFNMLYRHGFPPFADTDFLPTVKQLLASVGKRIVFHKGDFLNAAWSQGEIAVLHIDISKSYRLNTHILNEFATKLVPNSSVVIQQDYQHWSNPWVAASMELLKEYFELLSWTEENSVLFAYRKKLPPKIGGDVERAIRDKNTMRSLLRSAAKRFPNSRQRAALAKSLVAYDSNPGIERAWEFKLGATHGRNFLAEAEMD